MLETHYKTTTTFIKATKMGTINVTIFKVVTIKAHVQSFDNWVIVSIARDKSTPFTLKSQSAVCAKHFIKLHTL